MRKHTKLLMAATLFTLGTSFTALAAKSGTWVLEEDGWYCYDKSGDAYEEEFCLSNGKEFYVGEDGLLATSTWVTDYSDDAIYYIGSDGSKTTNAWKYLIPHDDDDADEAWYWFNAKGKMVTNERVYIGGNYYYFGEDGRMLTGWIDYKKGDVSNASEIENGTISDGLVFADENGARAESRWVESYGPGIDADDNDLDEDDLNWYYVGSNGQPHTGKKDIDGLTFLFGADGTMQTGWVGFDGSNYSTIDPDNNSIRDFESVYFVNDKETGYVRKNGWRKLANYIEFGDDDADTYWFYFAKNGKVFLPELATDSVAAAEVTFKNGEKNELTWTEATSANADIKTIDGANYLFDANGQMLSGLYYYDNAIHYFGGSNEGNLKTGTHSIKDDSENAYEFYFSTKTDSKKGYTKATAVTGNANGYLYINGHLIKSEDSSVYRLVEVDGVGSFIVDYKGKIQHNLKKDYELENRHAVYGYTFNANDNGKTFNTTDGIWEYAIVDANN